VDGHKRIKGRKRTIAVDTLGLLIRVLVHPANWADKDGLRQLLRRMPLYTRWRRVIVDGGYASPALIHWCLTWFAVELLVVKRPAVKRFLPLPCRWVVERTFAWLGKYRRLSKDYEALPEVSEAFIYLASIHLLTRRLARS
jgi:putative transposase